MPNSLSPWNLQAPENTGGGAGNAFASFLNNFANVYNKAKDNELEREFNKKMMEAKANKEKDWLAPYKGMDPIFASDVGTTTSPTSATQRAAISAEGVRRGGQAIGPAEQVTQQNYVLPSGAIPAPPEVQRQESGLVGFKRPAKEFAPMRASNATEARNGVKDAEKEKMDLRNGWMGEPVSQAAMATINGIKTPEELDTYQENGEGFLNLKKTIEAAYKDNPDKAKKGVANLIDYIGAQERYLDATTQYRSFFQQGKQTKHTAEWGKLISGLRQQGKSQKEAETIAEQEGVE